MNRVAVGGTALALVAAGAIGAVVLTDDTPEGVTRISTISAALDRARAEHDSLGVELGNIRQALTSVSDSVPADTLIIDPEPEPIDSVLPPDTTQLPDTIIVPPPTGSDPDTAGFRVLASRGFDSKAANDADRGPGGSDGWDGIEYRYPRFTIVQDPGAPTGDRTVGQMFYPAAHQSGTAPGTVQTLVNTWAPLPKSLYVRIDAKLSSNWVGNQSNTNKMFFVGAAGGNNQFFLSAEGSGRNALVPQVRLQGVEDPRARIAPNRAPGTQLIRGQWHRWEFQLGCNSAPNKADGTIRFWLDGRLVTEVNDVNWTQTKYLDRPCDFTIFHWSPTYGGGGASPGVDQYLWFDHVYVSGR